MLALFSLNYQYTKPFAARWDQTLTWALITAIGEDGDISCSLFPGPGANTSTTNGGGKKKTEFHFALTVILFENHEEYGDDFARIEAEKGKVKTALRRTWTGKIKNKISVLIRETRKHMAMMCDTGEGLTSQELEELQVTDPDLYNKWLYSPRVQSEVIKAEFPWYRELRDLIGNRLNSNPVGLGNSRSDVDVSVLSNGPQATSDTESEDADVVDLTVDVAATTDEPNTAQHTADVHYSPFHDNDELYATSSTPPMLRDEGTESAEEGAAAPEPAKHKRKMPSTELSDGEEDDADVGEGKATTKVASTEKDRPKLAKTSKKATANPATMPSKTHPTPSKTHPTPSKTHPTSTSSKGTSSKKSKATDVKGTKKLKYSEDFTKIAITEEHTKQKQLDLKRMDKQYKLEKLRMKADMKKETIRAKAELEKVKLQAAMEYRLAKLKYGRGSTAPAQGPFTGFSEQAQAGPSAFTDGRGQHGRGAPASLDEQLPWQFTPERARSVTPVMSDPMQHHDFNFPPADFGGADNWPLMDDRDGTNAYSSLLRLALHGKSMEADASFDPVGSEFVGLLVLDVDAKVLERLKVALEEANCMLGANSDDGYMVVELLIVWEVTVRPLVWCDHPYINLQVMYMIVSLWQSNFEVYDVPDMQNPPTQIHPHLGLGYQHG
ncbi:uncharacterized protein B0H18DRAFT_955038 [Fomitopsis serialis]|uniref:uncharacterized protein n=1 Tax=Fomitopsis serialis TaxID=139415 RepID=UPI002007E7AB|nr:uncharacterized protein B0H18DRAFT_955038 [Neoantrodia serialis]KAH9925508.1 hypothetical protein B0H18DRAFT_955038 [Neoantrodia serialis]